MRSLFLLIVGFCMGIADLIPGISGGTIAYLAGIYEELLLSIQSLSLHRPKEIAWHFLLCVGGGILLAVLSLGKVFHTLLSDPFSKQLLFAFFFGAIAGSLPFCLKEAAPSRLSHWVLLGCSALGMFFLCKMTAVQAQEGFWWLLVCGMAASGAMLLPGISGSFILHLLGVYPLVLGALAEWDFHILGELMCGVALGLILFSRLFQWLLQRVRSLMCSCLIGLMIGGLRSLWPFYGEELWLPLSSLCLGVGFSILLEISTKRMHNTISQK